MAVDIGIGLLDVIAVLLDGMSQSTDVIVRVVANLVTLTDDTVVELRVFTHIVAHHEEGGLHVERLQGVEDKGCRLRDGTVVEGQIDGLLVTVHPPIGSGIEPAEVDGGLLDKHILLLESAALRVIELNQTFQLLVFLSPLLLVDAGLQVYQLIHRVDVDHAVAL